MVKRMRWVIGVLVLAGAALTPVPGRAQIPKRETTFDSRAGPKEAADAGGLDEMARSARRVRDGILLLGHPRRGSGTGWVLSTKRRWVITNAHVADLLLKPGAVVKDGVAEGDALDGVAIRNGTGDVYKVKRVYYHPGVRRLLEGEPALSARSFDLRDGKVDANCPDLALVELEQAGPDLPLALPMAGWDQVKDLFAVPVGMIGYPAYYEAWPEEGRKTVATLRQGQVARTTDFDGRAEPEVGRQVVHHTASSWPGFSGSPLFSAAGGVVAVHNAGRLVENPNDHARKESLGSAIRIDAVWELLAYYKLEREVPIPVKTADLLLDRYMKEDAVSTRSRKAVAEHKEARRLLYGRRNSWFAEWHCSEALELAPGYAAAYGTRAEAALDLLERGRAPKENAEELANNAVKDAEQFHARKDTVASLVTLVRALNARDWLANKDLASRERSLKKVNEWLGALDALLVREDLSATDRAAALRARGFIRHERLGEKDKALQDLEAALKAAPEGSDCRIAVLEALVRHCEQEVGIVLKVWQYRTELSELREKLYPKSFAERGRDRVNLLSNPIVPTPGTLNGPKN